MHSSKKTDPAYAETDLIRPWWSSRLSRISAITLFILLGTWGLSHQRWASGEVSGTVAGRYLGCGFLVGDGAITVWGGRPRQFLGMTLWTGFRFDHMPAGKNGRSPLAKPPAVSWEWQAADRLAFRLDLWVIVLLQVLASIVIISFRQRRKRLGLERINRRISG